MYAAGTTSRRRSAYAARMEAKRQRQKWIVIALAVLLAAVVAYEVPNTFHLTGGKSKTTAAVTTPAPAAAKPRGIPRSLQASGDPFVTAALTGADPQMQGETGGHDPFARPGVAAAPASSAPATSAALPQQIVVGTPGGDRHAHRGWIVILASIPTAEGRGSAVRFASDAASDIGSLQILNSSNRRPLRGGYWVVYTGPYDTLAQVSQRSDAVHSAGYPTAYIRELIVYR